ncbi:hypothetical protein Rmet_6576 [Cupriavidus metallidurans CH34]|uniref:Uncharacterized protein n=1 Tax=Cupriavidus metallidurans (strain ATCC 43123 / DSM 2839 / NBRC 102507 / CH34) TaxID=266264 RepID=D3DY08_CUPMC|nr:hypothetical protein Rmet_6576 [Cupriavidus metallidurans CH34]
MGQGQVHWHGDFLKFSDAPDEHARLTQGSSGHVLDGLVMRAARADHRPRRTGFSSACRGTA